MENQAGNEDQLGRDDGKAPRKRPRYDRARRSKVETPRHSAQAAGARRCAIAGAARQSNIGVPTSLMGGTSLTGVPAATRSTMSAIAFDVVVVVKDVPADRTPPDHRLHHPVNRDPRRLDHRVQPHHRRHPLGTRAHHLSHEQPDRIVRRVPEGVRDLVECAVTQVDERHPRARIAETARGSAFRDPHRSAPSNPQPLNAWPWDAGS